MLRLARVLRKMHQPDSALAAYKELAGLDPAPVGGLPAGLVAPAARCEVLSELERRAAGELPEVYQFGDVELDFTRAELRRAGKPVEITPLE